MITFRILQNQVRQVTELIHNSDVHDETRKKMLVLACMMMQSHLRRCQQLNSVWNLLLRRWHIILKLRDQVSGQYCLPRKSQLLLNHVSKEQHMNILKTFRVSKATFDRLCTLVTTGKDHGWPEKLEVLVFLYWLVSGAAYRMVASKFGIPKSTANDIVHRVLARLLHKLHHIIYLPQQDELDGIGQSFAQLTGIPAFGQVVGCLDCYHIAIKPPKNLEQYYTNEKMYYSVKCQFLCDNNGLIRDIFVGFPGSVSDSQVLNLSPLYSKGEFPPKGYILLADNAYPCMESPLSILTPFPEKVGVALSGIETRFNDSHHKAWCLVRKTVTSMKSRWKRIFHQNLDASIRLAPKIAAACAIMHNISILTDGTGVQGIDSPNLPMARGRHLNENSEFRKQFARSVSSQLCTPNPPDHSYTC